MAYGFGLMAFTLVKVLAPGYFSRQDTKTPVRIGIIAMVTNISLNIIIVLPMVRMGLPAPHAGLALATGLAAAVNAVLLYRGLRRQGVYQPGDGWGWLAGRLLIANIAMAIVVLWLSGDLESWLTAGWQDRAVRLALCIGAGLATYLLALMVSGIRPRHFVVRDI
jgi:putative peptidoglycan lipid II flippase